MNRYRLKKDLPLASQGTEVVITNNSIIRLDSDCIVAEIRQDLISEWLEEIKENKRWRASRYGTYYYIDSA